LIERIWQLRDQAMAVEDQMSKMVVNNGSVTRVMTVSGPNVYSTSTIMAEIDNISRFATKEKLASYAGLVPRQDQSGNRDIKGHISKHGPSMLRFIMVNAAHIVIKYSERMRKKYLSLVRRLGKNRAIVAIARILLETIYTMLKTGEHFVDQIDTLTEREMKSMKGRTKNPPMVKDVGGTITYIREKRIKSTPKELFHRSAKVWYELNLLIHINETKIPFLKLFQSDYM
jgi:transposase